MNFENFKPSANLKDMLTEAGLSGGDQALLMTVLNFYAATFLTIAVTIFAAWGMQGVNSSKKGTL